MEEVVIKNGRAIIFAFDQFQRNNDIRDPQSAAKSLSSALEGVNFKVENFLNFKRFKIKKELERFIQEDADCFMIFFLSKYVDGLVRNMKTAHDQNIL